MPEKSNVVLITIDCLRQDHLGCYGYPNPNISPVMDQLAKNGVRFANAFANSSSTLVAFPSIMTSTMPFSYGGPKFLSEERISFAEVLKKNGYRTCAIQTNYWLSYHTNYTKGFDEFKEFYDPLDPLISGLRDIYDEKVRTQKDERALRSELIEAFEAHFEHLKSMRYFGSEEIAREHKVFKDNPSAYIEKFASDQGLVQKRRFKSFKALKARAGSLLRGRVSEYWITRLNEIATAPTRLFDKNLRMLEKPYADAETITNMSIEWINENKENPFFLWIHYMDVHQPYLPGGNRKWPEEMKKYQAALGLPKISIRDADVQRVKSRKALYAMCVRYVDDQIGRLVNALEETGKETIVVITSDHGEELFEHGHNNHMAKLYEEIVRVPLIVSSMNREIPSAERSKPVSHMDIGPTILHLCGIDAHLGLGKNLFSDDRREFIMLETLEDKDFLKKNIPFWVGTDIKKDYLVVGIRTPSKKMIYRESTDTFLYFDLNKDFSEKNSLVNNGSEFEFMKKAILKRIKEIKSQKIVEDYRFEDEKRKKAIMERLKALGYLR